MSESGAGKVLVGTLQAAVTVTWVPGNMVLKLSCVLDSRTRELPEISVRGLTPHLETGY